MIYKTNVKVQAFMEIYVCKIESVNSLGCVCKNMHWYVFCADYVMTNNPDGL